MEKLCHLNPSWLAIRSQRKKILNFPLTKKEKATLLPLTKWWFPTKTPKDPLLFLLSWLKLIVNLPLATLVPAELKISRLHLPSMDTIIVLACPVLWFINFKASYLNFQNQFQQFWIFSSPKDSCPLSSDKSQTNSLPSGNLTTSCLRSANLNPSPDWGSDNQTAPLFFLLAPRLPTTPNSPL